MTRSGGTACRLAARLYRAERPEDHVLALREVRRGVAFELDPDLVAHGVVGYLEGRRLQRPGWVVDLATVHALLLVERVQAVALRHPVLERIGRRVVDRPVRLVLRSEAGSRAVGLGALVRVADALSVLLDADVRLEVRDAVDPARRLHGQPARRVEAEEVDARLTVDRRVGADVDLVERRQAWRGRRPAHVEARDRERRYADPRAAVEGVERDLRVHHFAQPLGRDAPVGEQQALPRLAHDPGRVRHRPRTVAGFVEDLALTEGDLEVVCVAAHGFTATRCRKQGVRLQRSARGRPARSGGPGIGSRRRSTNRPAASIAAKYALSGRCTSWKVRSMPSGRASNA